jgi:hypothetical protein
MHMVQSSIPNGLEFSGILAHKRKMKTSRAMAPGTTPSMITLVEISRGGEGSHKDSEAFLVSARI